MVAVAVVMAACPRPPKNDTVRAQLAAAGAAFLALSAHIRQQHAEANCREEGAGAVRRPLVSPALRVALRPGGRARANGRAAAPHRLGATTGTGAAMGSV